MADENASPATLKQLAAVATLSFYRLVASKFTIACLALAATPILIVLILLAVGGFDWIRIQEAHTAFEKMLRLLFLHFVVFFTANIFGFAVMRQETDDQVLHFLLLQPIQRWMVVTGKFMAFIAIGSVICVGSLWVTYLLMTLPNFGPAAVARRMFAEGGALVLVKESAVMILGLMAYGAIALLMGLIFKSAFYAVFLLIWESMLPYLPPMLKLWTVNHYLHTLLPEKAIGDRNIFEFIGDPSPPWLCFAVLLGLPAVMLAISIAAFQFRECLYGET